MQTNCKRIIWLLKELYFVFFFFGLDAAPQEYPGTVEDEEEESPNYEEKAQEIVQSILQEVVNTVAGGEVCSLKRKWNANICVGLIVGASVSTISKSRYFFRMFHICSW